MVSLFDFVVLSLVLLGIGIYGLSTRRNAIRMLMSVELILNAASLNFVAFTTYLYPDVFTGWLFVLTIIAIAGAEAAIGMALFLSAFRIYNSADLDKLHLLREAKDGVKKKEEK